MQQEMEVDNMVYANPRVIEYTFYIDDEITEPSNYRNLFQALEYANETDVIKIVINSPGGMLDTTIQICHAIRTSKATVVGSLQGSACSGAGLVLMACHAVEISPHSEFMAHTSMGGDVGKLSDTTKSIEHSRKRLEQFYHDMFYGFLTEQEIAEVLEGKDIWLVDDEIHERMELRQLIIQEEEQDNTIDRSQLEKMTKKQILDTFLGEDSD